MANQKLSKESEPREGKDERKRKRDLPRRWGQNMLCLQKNKTGEPTVPWGSPEKLHYKRRGRVVKKEAEKKKETQEMRNSPGKTIRKICAERKY